jgi:hypothetical protein
LERCSAATVQLGSCDAVVAVLVELVETCQGCRPTRFDRCSRYCSSRDRQIDRSATCCSLRPPSSRLAASRPCAPHRREHADRCSNRGSGTNEDFHAIRRARMSITVPVEIAEPHGRLVDA